ncbi:hypothetical protein I4F81_008519 [Pyropia yezoensis]|uniref:Uncharacterized protein n=1 Tax=Pyropia yezoensis TaxID=2788 RepID=A0ACC3C8B1_PYRYE|nr:hypothetical protein I4F81_008519 [Neopyropia yezoensis]
MSSFRLPHHASFPHFAGHIFIYLGYLSASPPSCVPPPPPVSPVPSARCRRRLFCGSGSPAATAAAAAAAATLDEVTAPGGSRLVCVAEGVRDERLPRGELHAMGGTVPVCFCPFFCCDMSVMPALAAPMDLTHHTHLIMHARAIW